MRKVQQVCETAPDSAASVPIFGDVGVWVEVWVWFCAAEVGLTCVVGEDAVFFVGEDVGLLSRDSVGFDVGFFVGFSVGDIVGDEVGFSVGDTVGDGVGAVVGGGVHLA